MRGNGNDNGTNNVELRSKSASLIVDDLASMREAHRKKGSARGKKHRKGGSGSSSAPPKRPKTSEQHLPPAGVLASGYAPAGGVGVGASSSSSVAYHPEPSAGGLPTAGAAYPLFALNLQVSSTSNTLSLYPTACEHPLYHHPSNTSTTSIYLHHSLPPY